MVTESNRYAAERDNSSSESASSTVGGIAGTDRRDGGEIGEDDERIRSILDGASRTRNQAGSESDPQYTRPPTLGDVDPTIPKQRRGGRTPSNIKSPATAVACAAFMAVLFKAISLLLTRSFVLQLDDDEKKDLGGALHETLSNFPPTAPAVRVVNYVAPWAKLADASTSVVHRRYVFLMQQRARNMGRTPPPPPPRFEEPPDDRLIDAPIPVDYH